MKQFVTACIAIAVLGLLATPVRASDISIVLMSSGGGEFNYGLQLPGNTYINFSTGETITLSGLSGVTSASLINGSPLDGCFNPTFSATSVTLTASGFGFCGFFNIATTTTIAGTLDVLSSDNLNGASYEIVSDQGTFTGNVGAVATPEPASVLLMGSGLCALGRLRRRRVRSSRNQPCS